jgi:hypothetical protein
VVDTAAGQRLPSRRDAGQSFGPGLAQEAPAPIEASQLRHGALLINSLGCRPIRSLEGEVVSTWPEPEHFWRRLLADD